MKNMPRNQFSDVTPRKRSIRDIPIPRKQDIPVRPEQIEVKDDYIEPTRTSKPKGGGSGGRRWWLLIIILAIGGFWGASVLLHAAIVEIIPERAMYAGAIDIEAKTNASPTELQYDKLQFVETSSATVPSTSEEDVAIKASGKIMIYNNYSTSPQTLVANTRFESAAGNIYRIQNAVTVPGFTNRNGEKVPGSVEVTIYADQVGESYNATRTDFKIPGFKGTAQYDTFYARSTTDITGGFVGKQKKVDPAVLDQTVSSLKSEIETKIPQSIASKIPSDFVFIPGASTVEYTVRPAGSEGDQAVITVDGTVKAYVFKKAGIDESLYNSLAGMSAERVIAHDYSKLHVEHLIENEAQNTIDAVLSGEATLYAAIDKSVLAAELAGLKKSAIGTIMNQHEEILESQTFIRPPWMLSLPNNPARITIIEKIDE